MILKLSFELTVLDCTEPAANGHILVRTTINMACMSLNKVKLGE